MSDEPRGGFTRRDLVRGSLVGAIAASVGTTARAAPIAEVGPGPSPLELEVNGTVHRLSLEPRVTLVDALRDRIGLTGTKSVCGRGACGACTVLLGGKTVCSCLVLAHEAAGQPITTIEGLATDGRLTPLQEAFIAADALQCGFCTSGMILSCKALLEREPKPSRSAIREAVSGNLCRCGTYNHVFDAVERAAGLKTAEVTEPPILVGSRIPVPGSRHENDPRVDRALREVLDEEGMA
ncbi:MAG TPA: (2Fe-2S)-binding protein [Thermoanaerobaculia bacterium]|jgi:xanthine dehydrogenase YagT iron-sulfur-binding subunit|nr:(2Fe-2S)-binding protein [Thermoanaerobaculia bacterium]